MELKRKYIDKALVIFKHDGLRFSIDELAKKMGITKKTLYNHFSSKDELIFACIREIFVDLDAKLEIMNNSELNSIEGLIKTFEELQYFFGDHSPVFLNDLNKLYPKMINENHTMGFGNFAQKFKKNLVTGIEEGFYRNDLELNLICNYFTHSVFEFFIQSVISYTEFSSANYFETILKYHLYALVNEKGREFIT